MQEEEEEKGEKMTLYCPHCSTGRAAVRLNTLTKGKSLVKDLKFFWEESPLNVTQS